MKLKIYKNKSSTDALMRDSHRLGQSMPARLQFGNETVEISDDTDDTGLRESNIDSPDISEQKYDGYDSSWVHLVQQKGRLFNIEHPQVPVLYDRGRFQLVAIDPSAAKKLSSSDLCFTVSPVENLKVVFEQFDSAQRFPQIPAWEKNLAESVDADEFLAILRQLTEFRNRHSISDTYTEVTGILQEKMNALAYETRVEPIDIFNRTGQFVGQSSNLIAQKSGQNHPGTRLILVTAHLDSVNLQNQLDDSLIAPGADDNGSGSAGVMEIARIFSRVPVPQDIKFVLFGGEEQNLFGSSQYVANMTANEKSRLLAVINMDMIGVRNTTPSTVLIEGAPVSRHVIEGLALRAAAHTDLLVRTSENPFASDHVPFINEGLPAVLTIEGDDSQNSTIHTAADVIDNINVDYAVKILKMNVGYIASLSGAPSQ